MISALKYLILLMFLSIQINAQQYLYVKKKGELPAERIGLHEHIKLRVSGGEDWVNGSLKMIGTESVTIGQQTFLLKNIEAIRTYNGLVRLTGTALWAGGVFFTSIAFVNRLINNDRPLLYPGQMALGVGLVAGGLLVSWSGRKTYKMAKGYFLEVIDLNKE